MMNRPHSQDWRGSEPDQTSLAWFFGRMFLIPFQTLIYGMERIVEAMRNLEKTTGRGVSVIAGGPLDAAPSHAAAAPASPTPEPAGGAPEISHHVEEEKRPMDKNLNDDMLKLVRFKILFVKRGYEHAFPEQEALVYDNMDGTAFTAWKVAEFIQSLGRGKTDVPHSWGSYPLPEEGKPRYRDGNTLVGLPEDDKKYLRVYYEVLERYTREKFRYEERQVGVLEEIRDTLKEKKQ